MSERETIQAWFAGRIPDPWTEEPAQVRADADEILVALVLAAPALSDEPSEESRAAAADARIDRFREETRDERMRIAEAAQRRFGRKVSWAAACDGVERLFTHLSVPAMTRLRLPERQLLDTLVDAGVARSRSHALAWCVRQVGRAHADWLARLREAFAQVESVRAQGPGSPHPDADPGA